MYFKSNDEYLELLFPLCSTDFGVPFPSTACAVPFRRKVTLPNFSSPEVHRNGRVNSALLIRAFPTSITISRQLHKRMPALPLLLYKFRTETRTIPRILSRAPLPRFISQPPILLPARASPELLCIPRDYRPSI